VKRGPVGSSPGVDAAAGAIRRPAAYNVQVATISGVPVRSLVSTAPAKRPAPLYGRGTGVPNPIDVHVGAHIRTRRLLQNSPISASHEPGWFQAGVHGGSYRIAIPSKRQANICETKIFYGYISRNGTLKNSPSRLLSLLKEAACGFRLCPAK